MVDKKGYEWKNFFSKNKKRTVFSALKNVVLFENLSSKQVKKIEHIGHLRTFKDKEVVFYKGDPSYGLFILLDGKVNVCLSKRHIQEYCPFDYFGEFSLIQDSKRTATAIANGSTKLYYLPSTQLKDLFKNDARMGLQIYERIFETLIRIIKRYDKDSNKKR